MTATNVSTPERTHPVTAVLICGHGGLPDGMLDAATLILGPQRAVAAVGLRPDQSAEDYAAAVRAEGGAAGNGTGAWLFLADLTGGTPANAALRLAATDPDLAGSRVVSGVNLGMLLEVLLRREAGDDDVAALAGLAVTSGAGACTEIVVPTLTSGDGST